jgi:Cu/Ag efflux protein CusF
MMTRTSTAILMIVALFTAHAATARGQAPPASSPAPAAPAAKAESKPAIGEARQLTVRGTISAIDKDNRTVTLKGPKGRTVTIEVADPAKLDALKVGDPVVGTYVEALAIEVKKAGSSAPGASMEERRVGSKPGENPAGAIGRQVTVTATITAVNTKAPSVTIKGPKGNVETVKVKDAKNLANVKAGDLVEITYTQALAVALDKPTK